MYCTASQYSITKHMQALVWGSCIIVRAWPAIRTCQQDTTCIGVGLCNVLMRRYLKLPFKHFACICMQSIEQGIGSSDVRGLPDA